MTPFKFNHASVTLAGTSINVEAVTLSGDNGLDTDRRYHAAEPLEAELRTYEGSMDVETDWAALLEATGRLRAEQGGWTVDAAEPTDDDWWAQLAAGSFPAELAADLAQRMERLAADLLGDDPRVAAEAAMSAQRLIDLDDPADAASPTGIAVALTMGHATMPVEDAAQLLGLSRRRVEQLAQAGVLERTGWGRVSRASVARRLRDRRGTGRLG